MPPPAVQTYYDKRNELIKSQGLVFRGKQLVLPLSLRKDMPTQLHEILYWPRMSAEIRDFVSRCPIYQTYRPAQTQTENCRRSVCHWTADIPDNGRLLVQFL